MMKRFACSLVIAVAGSACGGGDRPSVDVNSASLCREIAEVVCYNLYSCCTEGEIEDFLGVDEPQVQEDCRDDAEILCERATATVRWSEENGRVQLNAASFKVCLEAILAPADTCVVVAPVAPWTEACLEDVWTGLVAAGGECLFDYECAEERSFCAANRTCRPPSSEGESCVAANCAVGLFCGGGVCEPLLDLGSPCSASFQCAEGLFCAPGSGMCEQRRGLDESCTSSSACVAGTTCLPGTCAAGNSCFDNTDCSTTCENDGSFCFFDSDCSIGTCSQSLFQCFSDFDCTGGTDLCEFPFQCLPAICEGDPRCVENNTAFDYCEDAVGILF